MTTKLGKELLTVTSHDPLNTWSHEVTTQLKIIKWPISQCLWSPNLSGGFIPLGTPTHKLIWSFGHMVLRGHVTNWIRFTPFAGDLWARNKVRLWLAMRDSNLESLMTSHWSRGRLTKSYLNFHKTWQGTDFRNGVQNANA